VKRRFHGCPLLEVGSTGIEEEEGEEGEEIMNNDTFF
jgi:hypothetical protein